MFSFEATFPQTIHNHLIAELDIRVTAPCLAELPLTIEAAILAPSAHAPQWVDIPLTHPLYADIDLWLQDRHALSIAQVWRNVHLQRKSPHNR